MNDANWIQVLNELVDKISTRVWGPYMLTLLVGTGILFTFRLAFLQFRLLPYALKQAFVPHKSSADHEGDVSHFGALMTALSATIGTGNIAGVATAVGLGLAATVSVAAAVSVAATVSVGAAVGVATTVVLGGLTLRGGALAALDGEGAFRHRGHGLARRRLTVVGAGQNQYVLPVGRIGRSGQIAHQVAVGVNRQLAKGVVDAGVALVLEEDGHRLAGVEPLGIESEGLGLVLRARGDLVRAGDARVVEEDLSLLLGGRLSRLRLAAVGHAAGADGPSIGSRCGRGADGLDECRQVEVLGPGAVRGGLGLDDVGGGAVRGVERDADGRLLS